MKPIYVALLAIISVLLNLNACSDKEVIILNEQKKSTDSLLQNIDILEVELRPISNVLILNGKVNFESENIVEIFPIFGGNVTEVRVELGDYVNKGDILAIIKSSGVADLKKEEIEANANYMIAKRNYNMIKDMSESGLASEKDLIEAQAELENSNAQLNKIKEVFSIYNIRDNSEYVIKAPISGFIVDKKISREMLLRDDNNSEIFVISKLDNIWILADVYERDINKVKVGNNVEISVPAYPDMKFNTTIDRIYNVLASESNTLTIRMKLENYNYLLKPGMFTKVVVQCDTGKDMFPTIVENALIFDKNKYFVIVANGNDFEIREVEPFNIDKYISINKGLNVGEKVVVKNVLVIYNAMKDK